METWLVVLLAVLGFIVVAFAAFLIWLRRSAMSPSEAAAELRALGVDLVRLPRRLRRVAAAPRCLRRARWWLIGLAIYIVSPIDVIPHLCGAVLRK